jgi:hypothetical protein
MIVLYRGFAEIVNQRKVWLEHVFPPLKVYSGMEQLVARWAHNPKVVGSSPAPATIKHRVKLILQVSVIQMHVGGNPSHGTRGRQFIILVCVQRQKDPLG